jgi:hypothetical protein
MAAWDSADLADRFWLSLGRGNGGTVGPDELWTADRTYRVLADAQEQVYTDFAPAVPQVFVSPPLLLTSSDGGRTFTFGADVYPMGHVEVYAEEGAGRPLYATTYDDRGGDFVIEGPLIRTPGNQTRTYARGPYARYVGFPPRLSASVEPGLQPPGARELILYRALILAAEMPNGEMDPTPWEVRYTDARNRWMRTWQTQYSTQGGAARPLRASWWLTMDAMNGSR